MLDGVEGIGDSGLLDVVLGSSSTWTLPNGHVRLLLIELYTAGVALQWYAWFPEPRSSTSKADEQKDFEFRLRDGEKTYRLVSVEMERGSNNIRGRSLFAPGVSPATESLGVSLSGVDMTIALEQQVALAPRPRQPEMSRISAANHSANPPLDH